MTDTTAYAVARLVAQSLALHILYHALTGCQIVNRVTTMHSSLPSWNLLPLQPRSSSLESTHLSARYAAPFSASSYLPPLCLGI